MKIKNFTIEGKHLTMVAHLDFETRTQPVYELLMTDPDLLSGVPQEDIAKVLDEIRDEAYRLHHDWDIMQICNRFREDWEEDAHGIRMPDVAEE